jgi:cobalt-zinc-cadmium efflux system outer membrane protein
MSSTQQQWRLALAVTMGCVFAPAHSQETSRTPVQVPEPTPLTTTKVSLAELNARLRGANPDIAIALAASRGGDALVRSADTSLNPTLSFGAASISNSQGIGAGPLKDKRIDQFVRIDQTFERGGKRSLRKDAAQEGARATQFDLTDARRMALMQLASTYYDLLSAQERAAAADDARQSSDRLANLAQLRQKEGDLSVADLTRINIDRSRAINDAQSARLDVSRAQVALAQLLNDKSATAYEALEEWPDFSDLPPADNALEALVNQRADVQAARHRLTQARQLLALAQAQRSRDVSLGAQMERNPSQISGVTFGLFVSVPLFTGNDFAGDIEKASADVSVAQAQLDKASAAARSDWRRMTSEQTSLAGRWLRYRDEILPNVKRSTRAADLAFRSGAISIADLLDAQRTARALQAEAVQAHAELAKSQLNLEIMKQVKP